MPGGFVKLYGTILDSSVWSEDPYTRLVWITMLAMANADGFVEAAVPGLARRANVPLEQCQAALERLESPDPYSKSPEHEGRRVERVDRGFRILNYTAYRELRTEDQIRAAERQKRYKQKHRSVTADESNAGKTQVSASLSDVVVSVGGGVGGETHTPPAVYVPSGPANPLLAGRRPEMEREGYRLIREIAATDPTLDPLDILFEAAKWETKDGRYRTKLRLETMTDDHLIRTIHDLKGTLVEVKADAKAKARRG